MRDILGHYRIIERLGAGGMGEVFLAEDTVLGRKVAIKVLSQKMARVASHRARFEQEARAIAALNHPNIVTVHSVEQLEEDSETISFITMEYVEGKQLSDLIPEEGLPSEALLDLALPLADALSAAHQAGITHRDLKPANIMVTTTGRVKVLDFGLAKLRDASIDGQEPTREIDECVTEEGKILGTVAYMSPEQGEGRPVGPASDVFSLGILLFEMASGRRPFTGTSHISTILSIIKDSPEELISLKPQLAPEFAAIVKRCLNKDPAARFPSGVEVAQALSTLRSSSQSLSGLTAVRRRLPRWIFIAGALILGALAIGFLALVSRPEATVEDNGPSVAVLPFRSLGEDRQDYFAEGMTAEITTKLSRIRNLSVTSMTSAARFRDVDEDIRDIGAELGVRFVLEGSVRRNGERVRITAQLVQTSNGFEAWSGEFEGTMGDVFGLQEETALKIADALDVELSTDEEAAVMRRYTANAQAYDAYLRGRALIEYFSSPEKMEAAESHFERALEFDPEYPLALVGLSRVQAQYYRNLDPRPERLERARELAQQALEIDPQLAEGYLALGQVLGNEYRYAEAARFFRKAIEIDPANAYAWDLLSWVLAYQQPPDAAAAEDAARRSISLQASLIGAHYHLGRALLLQERFDEARAAFEQAIRLDPDFEAADYGLAQVHIARGEYRKALEFLERLQQLRSAPVVPVQFAIVYEALGRRAEAGAALESALASGYEDLPALLQIDEFAQWRSEPQFDELLAKYRLRDPGAVGADE